MTVSLTPGCTCGETMLDPGHQADCALTIAKRRRKPPHTSQQKAASHTIGAPPLRR